MLDYIPMDHGALAQLGEHLLCKQGVAGSIPARSIPRSPRPPTPMSLPVPAVGTAAPEFSLNTTSGAKVTLSELKGKRHVLLAFFPLAFTSTCTAEMCAFSDDYAAFAERDVEVIPVSVDAVPSLRAFKAMHDIGVELASDFKREASRAYGTLLEHAFFSTRAYFLIDKDGIIRWSHVEEIPGTRRENAELLAEIAKLTGT
jgi:peroxiredoxin